MRLGKIRRNSFGSEINITHVQHFHDETIIIDDFDGSPAADPRHGGSAVDRLRSLLADENGGIRTADAFDRRSFLVFQNADNPERIVAD